MLIGIFVAVVLVVLFFASGKKTPSRPPEVLPSPSIGVRQLAGEGKAIDAIKLYRRESGASLREAKNVVDRLRR